ncbi:MAG: hypothetical protein OEV35_01980 [Gallionellaceae bacterium]|nr:hypothetical protein [Gallionellaceae bacterium]
MGIAIDMDSFRASGDSSDEIYSDEVMYSGWNPAITQLCQVLVPTNRLLASIEDEGSALEDEDLLLPQSRLGDTGYSH